ncbi:MAG TPA: CD1375 family protein [Methylomusa anaerophila]|uniref:Uncharacterized protein n=1 Tax=Methylomusa anaerophila TaxID=1930071 RepID=A0A348AJ22_9FIRM|nr:CD1375 family protein [Methylomusa anaerophila]BBB91070.1 hypothetical protein MAMMFC1_01738 [Methylomusa anaerophila]HML88945.1 CD1375 family protein [Methylomusa anaerophila]
MATAIIPALVRVYANLVENGRRTIDQVPEDYREAVQEYMKQS